MTTASKPLTFNERCLKWASLFIVLLSAGLVKGCQVASYRGGLTCGDYRWWGGIPLILGPIFVLLFLAVHGFAFVVAIRHRRIAPFVGLCLAASYAVLFANAKYGKTGAEIFLAGFKERIETSVSLNDLRQIRDVILTTRQKGISFESHQVERIPGNKIEAPDVASQCSFRNDDLGSRWQALCSQTKIEKLVGRGRVYVESEDDAATLEWGGALPGHWGLMMGSKRIEPRQPQYPSIRLAEDILLYYGD